MPKYKYACSSCGWSDIMSLPISCDPKKMFCCSSCYTGNMTRKIIGSNSIQVKKETFGEWYKKNTGKELLG